MECVCRLTSTANALTDAHHMTRTPSRDEAPPAGWALVKLAVEQDVPGLALGADEHQDLVLLVPLS
jgi:hypothetical protein